MLTNIKKPFNIPRLLVGTILLALSMTTFLVITYILLTPLMNFFMPVMTNSLPTFLYTWTEWTTISVSLYNYEDTFCTLVTRVIILGTVGLTLIFLLAPPAHLIWRGAAGETKTSKVVSLRGYFWSFLGLEALSLVFFILDEVANNMGVNIDVFAEFATALNIAAWFLLPHFVLMHFLVGFWNFGCELVQPFLRQETNT